MKRNLSELHLCVKKKQTLIKMFYILFQIFLYPRGFKPIKLPFKVTTKIPNVIIQEDKFNFGKLTT